MAGCATPLSYDAMIHSREYVAMRERIKMNEALHFALPKKKKKKKDVCGKTMDCEPGWLVLVT